jgi:hypothetical protein
MSILHINQIGKKVSELFSQYLDKSDINHSDSEYDVKTQTRSLAAYAIYNHIGCSVEEAAQAVVDGGNDNGIDAIYYSASLKEMVIVQSKWIKDGSGEPSSGDVAKFCNGVEDLINCNFDRFNRRVEEKQAAIESAISSFDTRYTLIVIYTGTKGLSEHSQRLINDLINKLNDAGDGALDDLVIFKKMDQAKIYSSLSKGLFSEPINIEIGLYQWGKMTEPFGAYYGYISGEEIGRLWQDYGRRLFDKNIRNVLGKTEVNDELVTTIREAPEKFWFFNNGITITADLIEKSLVGGSKRDLGSFKLNGASIVNGAQTISSIRSQSSTFPENLKRVYVLAKVISLEGTPLEFGNEVTKANNRQNRIENRDFVSQDSEQVRLRQELAHDGINYNIIRADSFINTKTSFDVEEATVALACASGLVPLAVQAKREIGKFYENLTRGIYKQIFNHGTTGRQVHNCVAANREIEKYIAIAISSLPKKGGKDYGILIHGNRMISLLVFRNLIIPTTEIIKLDTTEIAEEVDLAIRGIRDAISKDFSDNILGTLFKNKTKCQRLLELVIHDSTVNTTYSSENF